MNRLRIGLAQINANRTIEGTERGTCCRSPLDRKNGEGIVRCIRKCGSRGDRRGK